MKALKNSMVALFASMGILLTPAAQIFAVDQATDCSKEIILSFFPAEFVKKTLAKFNVPAEQAEPIATELAAKDKNVISLVEDKAAKMDPNPLKDSSKQAEAVKIFRETLFETFASVLNAHGVTDEKKIQEMLDDIQMQKAKRFAECFPQQDLQPKKDAPKPEDQEG